MDDTEYKHAQKLMVCLPESCPISERLPPTRHMVCVYTWNVILLSPGAIVCSTVPMALCKHVCVPKQEHHVYS